MENYNHYLSLAIRKLHPEAEFSFGEDGYTSVKWDNLDGVAPTESEINAAIVKVKAEEIAATAQAATAKAALLAKLGITAEEAALLLS